ncbi:hypothetical protein RRG08_067332 [Elysia crispata]|uniref:Uncharacterized protein n=1 Tax=Elysia crispata TaxID=231223 RepID=A0AAE1B876_9GAST|nr:hypothetical protein RRG08_067332 [Elysia crispata]
MREKTFRKSFVEDSDKVEYIEIEVIVESPLVEWRIRSLDIKLFLFTLEDNGQPLGLVGAAVQLTNTDRCSTEGLEREWPPSEHVLLDGLDVSGAGFHRLDWTTRELSGQL